MAFGDCPATSDLRCAGRAHPFSRNLPATYRALPARKSFSAALIAATSLSEDPRLLVGAPLFAVVFDVVFFPVVTVLPA